MGSTRPIKCKLQRKAGQDVPVGQYKWNPSSIDGAGDLCEIKERCAKPQSLYNLTNKLLSYEKFTEGRRIFYNFSCADMVTENRVFEMMPYPVDHVTCTCNFNKPNNVRCKWTKFNEGDSGFAYDDMYESYDNY